jgi:hypothetical protein
MCTRFRMLKLFDVILYLTIRLTDQRSSKLFEGNVEFIRMSTFAYSWLFMSTSLMTACRKGDGL